MAAASADPGAGRPFWFGAADAAGEVPARPGESLYGLIGSRWVVCVLRELAGGTLRYNALRRRVGGITPKVLTQTLRRLQGVGLVRRRVHAGVPPAVDYGLTGAGTELLENLAPLERWARDNDLL